MNRFTRRSFFDLLDNVTFDAAAERGGIISPTAPFSLLIASSMEFLKKPTHFMCQITVGAVVPVAGVLFRIHAPSLLGLMAIFTTTCAFSWVTRFVERFLTMFRALLRWRTLFFLLGQDIGRLNGSPCGR